MNQNSNLETGRLLGEYQEAMNKKNYIGALRLNHQIYIQVFNAYLETKDKLKKESHKALLERLSSDAIGLTHNKLNTEEEK